MKAHFITFANSDSDFSFNRIRFEAHEMGLFSTVSCYTEKDFDQEYVDKFGSHFTEYKRGYGYWSWKPYLIKKKISEIEDGDFVVYADCGCMFLYENRNTLLQWLKIAMDSESGILSPCYGPYLERQWSRMDLYDYINKNYNKDNIDIFENAVQCGAGILVVYKNKKSEEFINIWNDIMSNHFHLCTDEPSSIPNHKEFRENRHDQSVFSMLSKIYGIATIETKDGILNKYTSPIIASRCKNDKNTWKKPIKILFDSQAYDLQEFGGISRMYVDLSNEFNRNEIVDNYTGSGVARGKYPEFFAKFSVSETKNFYLSKLKPYSYGDAKNRELSEKMISDGDYDILYPTFFSTYFLSKLKGKPFVMSVHDMIPELYPQYFNETDMQIVGKREMVKQAAAIEVPSETTKRDLIRILGVDENKIFVVGRGIDDNFGNNIPNKRLVEFKYVLYVGQRNSYKRFNWFIKHSSKFFNKHTDIKLLCCGNDFTNKEVELLNEYNMSSNAFVLKPDDETLANLYKYAEFFVFPSEYEGFGLPVLESYKMGCIALLNNNDCFREVTFGNGTYFNLDENESNICDVMEKTITLTKDEKDKIIEKQYKILSHYSIKKTAEKIEEMFRFAARKQIPTQTPENLDIFICTHKPIKPLVSNSIYKVANSSRINNDTAPNGLKGSFYSEIMTYLWINKNYNIKDYIGFCHYRKYWTFMDDVPNMDAIFKEFDAIVAKPIKLNCSVYENYDECHNAEDLDIVEKIVNEKHSEYSPAFKAMKDAKLLIPYNMFIMRKQDFIDYCEFIETILNEYLEVVGLDIVKRIEDNKDKYLKDFYPNNTIEYQYRIGGYLAERLTNVFMINRFKRLKWYEVKITEGKYKKIDENK